jgi:hypothetical protein
VVRHRAITLAGSGLLALAAVLTAFAGSALATSPNTLVLVTDPPTAAPSVTVDPSSTPCLVEVTLGRPAIGFCTSPSPVTSATASPTCIVLSVAPAAPEQSVCPIVTPTPFESFQGETAAASRGVTPPPTSTANGSSNGDATPTLALLIALVFGGLGLAAVASQRRKIRR